VAAVAALEPDTQLMLRLKAGDTSSFTALLERHRTPVVRFLFRMVQNQAVAEELAQEVFLRVYRSRASYEPTAKFTTWLFRIATNLALNQLRNGSGERSTESLDETYEGSEGDPVRQAEDRTPNIEQHLMREARLQQVREAIAALPEKQRAAVLMHKYEGMDYAQIGKILNASESAVKSLLFRAYEKLRERLAHLNE
jgi:RNA polymerase sigma-70 factor, ECF subfamily